MRNIVFSTYTNSLDYFHVVNSLQITGISTARQFFAVSSLPLENVAVLSVHPYYLCRTVSLRDDAGRNEINTLLSYPIVHWFQFCMKEYRQDGYRVCLQLSLQWLALTLFNRNPEEFIRRYITDDEV